MSQSLFAASKVVAEPLVINEVGKNAQVVTSLFLSFVVGISEMVIDRYFSWDIQFIVM